MPRQRPTKSRGVLEVDWPFFGELCRSLAVRVSNGYDPEIVVGIAKAGVIPAAIVATILQRPFAAMVIARPEEGSNPELISGPPSSASGKRVLLVDETCDTGDTLKLAVHALKAVGPLDIKTAVSFQTGVWQTDFHAFETDKAIILPWDREVVQGGELRTRPDIADWVGG